MFSCKAVCAPTDPTTDTVKINFQAQAEEDDRAQQEEAERLRNEEEEAERLRKEEEEKQRAELEAKILRERAEAEAKRMRAEQERRAEEARKAELARKQAEEARQRELAEAARAAEESRKAAVAAFLKEHNFAGVNAPRRKLLKTKYAIHKAAKEGDAGLVEMLLLEGADPKQKDSRGKTAAQVAHAKNSKGSHSSVIALLGGQPQPTVGGA